MLFHVIVPPTMLQNAFDRMKSIYKKCQLGEAGNIRLMEIQPGAGNDVVRFRLKRFQLDKSPPYEWLSYM